MVCALPRGRGDGVHLLDDRPGRGGGVFCVRGAPAPEPEGHAGLCRRRDDGGLRVEFAAARHRAGGRERRVARLGSGGGRYGAGRGIFSGAGRVRAVSAPVGGGGVPSPERPFDDGHHPPQYSRGYGGGPGLRPGGGRGDGRGRGTGPGHRHPELPRGSGYLIAIAPGGGIPARACRFCAGRRGRSPVTRAPF